MLTHGIKILDYYTHSMIFGIRFPESRHCKIWKVHLYEILSFLISVMPGPKAICAFLTECQLLQVSSYSMSGTLSDTLSRPFLQGMTLAVDCILAINFVPAALGVSKNTSWYFSLWLTYTAGIVGKCLQRQLHLYFPSCMHISMQMLYCTTFVRLYSVVDNKAADIE